MYRDTVKLYKHICKYCKKYQVVLVTAFILINIAVGYKYNVVATLKCYLDGFFPNA